MEHHAPDPVSLQDLLSLEVKWGYRDLPYPDRIWLHRKGKPGHAEEEPLAHELRCFPNTPQVSGSVGTGSARSAIRNCAGQLAASGQMLSKHP